jgi:hypothetical protein
MVLIVALRIAADRSAIIPRKHMVLFSIMFVLIAMGIATNTGNPVRFSLVCASTSGAQQSSCYPWSTTSLKNRSGGN